MSYLKKFGFLRGLAEGLSLDDQTKEGRVLLTMIDLLDDITDTLSGLENTQTSLQQELRTISQDNGRLNEAVEDLGRCMESITDGLGRLLDVLSSKEGEDGEDGEDEDGYFYEVKCPQCGEEIVLGEAMLEAGHMNCPKCKGLLEFDLSCDSPDCEDCRDGE